jgi:hypothetical protein
LDVKLSVALFDVTDEADVEESVGAVASLIIESSADPEFGANSIFPAASVALV